MADSSRDHLLSMFDAALDAVKGHQAVLRHLQTHKADFTQPIQLVAVGKAASSMAQGALAFEQEGGQNWIERGLVITKHGHLDDWKSDSRFDLYESAHPVPTQDSLDAGVALLNFIASAPDNAAFLFLVSGGASSLVEVLQDGLTLADLAEANRWLLGSGLDITGMNRIRRQLSRIKGGNLMAFLDGRPAKALLISDVPGDDPAVIGSGPLMSSGGVEDRWDMDALTTSGVPEWLKGRLGNADVSSFAAVKVPHNIVAGNQGALAAAAQRGRELGYPVSIEGRFLEGDAEQVAKELVEQLKAADPGVYLWGGETTVQLPDNPGRGGRNQHLALAAATGIQGADGLVFLSVGTDGSDGPGKDADAGALVDGQTLKRGVAADPQLDPHQSLVNADAGRFLNASGDLVHTGPTGTNVMDLVIALKTA